MAGRVFVIEPLGDRKIVDAQLSEDIVKAKTPPATRLEVGQPVWLAPDSDRLHVCERETERKLV